MRDLDDYLIQYNHLPFEDIQILYRRKKVLEILNEINPKHVLERGCGFSPLFLDYKKYTNFTLVEPLKKFFENANKFRNGDERIKIYKNLFEESYEDLRNKKYDFIVASSILHELDDPNQFLDTIKKLSNPSTVSCIIVPNSHSFHRLLAVSMGLIENEFEMSNTQLRMQQNSTFNLDNLCQLIKEKDLTLFLLKLFH